VHLRLEEEKLRDAAEHASNEELRSLRDQLDRSEARQRELQDELANSSVRQVPVYEHRKYLDRALSEAEKRVLIISPWSRFEIVDDELVTRFRKLLEGGIELWIAYGITKQGGYRSKTKGEGDRDAERKLERLGDVTRLGDTHAKVLVCDARFSIIPFFNWLSFRGNEQLEFRDERGYYVGLP
jgi:phosphatidylserine/phosphatidylglycerophosphate/cardiolipin synthase-like enzyme